MLVAKQQELDLGTLKYGKPKNFFFELTNKSTEMVHINQVIVGCQACTTAYISTPDVKPGETFKVNATFTPGSTGINSKSISVTYNNKMTIKLKFKSVVEK